MLTASPDAQGRPQRWIAGGLGRLYQSDWYFHSLLRQYEPDLLAGEFD